VDGRHLEGLKNQLLILIFLIFPVVAAARRKLSEAGRGGWAGA